MEQTPGHAVPITGAAASFHAAMNILPRPMMALGDVWDAASSEQDRARGAA
ncbi:hypothetical protein [Hirschia baltica]|uniref:hypothetical protein n=1 Tax=Hirschia baltica TaxID=2724 RepID=UPI0002FA9DB8|nr:hypothetical protein [Hirschia baltica]